MNRIRSQRAALVAAMALTIMIGSRPGVAADSPVGKWSTVDDKSGKVTSEVQLDPDDGEVYKAEIWQEGGKLKVRGFIGPLFKTQTWVKSS